MRIRISGRRKIGLREFFPWPLLVFTGVYWVMMVVVILGCRDG